MFGSYKRRMDLPLDSNMDSHQLDCVNHSMFKIEALSCEKKN
jgi:hypothetical protein